MAEKRIIIRVLMGLLTLVMALAIAQPTPVVKAATITVDTTADDTDFNGNCTLREAIIAANTDTAVDNCTAGSGSDTIFLSAGSYMLSIPGVGENATVTGDLDITSSLTITGASATSTIIDGGELDRVLHIGSGAAVSISDVTITNGNIDICCDFDGGGILNEGTLAIANSTISGNSAEGSGGGILNNVDATLALIRTTVSDNSAVLGEGGGIFNNIMAILTITNSTISGNSAGYSGAGAGGGGIRNNVGTIGINNTTITDNSADRGGGILAGGGTVNVKNTIIAGNTVTTSDPDIRGFFFSSLGNNLVGVGTAIGFTDGVNGDQVGTIGSPINPLLRPLQDNGGPTLTHALLTGSPAIDVIPLASCLLSTDQRGIHRPQGSACEIGAFEAEAVQVIIDVKPDSDPNSINLASMGVVPVAIFTTDDFDATSIDPTSVSFAGANPLRWASEDVDLDGDSDLVFHFRTQELDLDENSSETMLVGETFGGREFWDVDTVKIKQ